MSQNNEDTDVKNAKKEADFNYSDYSIKNQANVKEDDIDFGILENIHSNDNPEDNILTGNAEIKSNKSEEKINAPFAYSLNGNFLKKKRNRVEETPKQIIGSNENEKELHPGNSMSIFLKNKMKNDSQMPNVEKNEKNEFQTPIWFSRPKPHFKRRLIFDLKKMKKKRSKII
jgi:hypothetical protein